MTTHVFIVDDTTFKAHLEYMFVGTGAQDRNVDFNGLTSTGHHHKIENNLVGMMSDLSRIRIGDSVIFYLQQNHHHEGKFFGIFKIKDAPFVDATGNYLNSALGKKLTFRCLIEQTEVYAEGISEWEALDEIKHISSPNQMLWSLIYRKLKGNRGNTMITICEADRLFHLIRCKNSHKQLPAKSGLSFDGQKLINSVTFPYSGIKTPIDIIPRLLSKYASAQAYESHLQAYTAQFIDDKSRSLHPLLVGHSDLEWLGNEVSCGVGMQRIDVVLSLSANETEQRFVVPIELKCKSYEIGMINQLQRYVDWLNQYYIPNRPSIINPVIITQRNRRGLNMPTVLTDFNNFNARNPDCLPARLIEFEINASGTDLVFSQTI